MSSERPIVIVSASEPELSVVSMPEPTAFIEPNEAEIEARNRWEQAIYNLRYALEQDAFRNACNEAELAGRLWRSAVDRRISVLTKALRAVAAPSASDDVSALACRALYGTNARNRNPYELSRMEAEVVRRYRQTDAAGRQMLRTLLERLAATSESAANTEDA
jgi:hypothetical protein